MASPLFRVAAIDLGASSGRVSVVEVGQAMLRATCVHRFPTHTVHLGKRLVWDLAGLYAGVEAGLAAAAATGPVDSVGVDAWGCDYGLIDPAGDLSGLPICYRDGRTLTPGDDGTTAVERVHAVVGRQALYSITGTQFQPFDTIYQIVADARCGRLHTGDIALMIPDLIAYWLTGQPSAEVTNASTTGLLDPSTRHLATRLIEPLEKAAGIAPDSAVISHWRTLLEPGTIIGPVAAGVAGRTGLPAGTPVVAVASHDTASAVAAVPAAGHDWAYVSSGTWSLVGVELPKPVVTEAGRAANFTNELGLAGTVRYLRNVTGLWVLNECLRAWQAADAGVSLAWLMDAAAAEPAGKLFDIDDPSLAMPGPDMPGRVAHLTGRTDTADRNSLTPAAVTRAIVDSLAHAYAEAIDQAGQLSGRQVAVVHIVGGGSQNALLCQSSADATGLPVVAGPAEASTLGNGLVQAWALGWRSDASQQSGSVVTPDGLAAMRALIARTQPLVRYEPQRKEPIR